MSLLLCALPTVKRQKTQNGAARSIGVLRSVGGWGAFTPRGWRQLGCVTFRMGVEVVLGSGGVDNALGGPTLCVSVYYFFFSLFYFKQTCDGRKTHILARSQDMCCISTHEASEEFTFPFHPSISFFETSRRFGLVGDRLAGSKPNLHISDSHAYIKYVSPGVLKGNGPGKVHSLLNYLPYTALGTTSSSCLLARFYIWSSTTV